MMVKFPIITDKPVPTTRKAWGLFDPARPFICLFARRIGVGSIAGLRRSAFAPLLSMPAFHFASAGRPSAIGPSVVCHFLLVQLWRRASGACACELSKNLFDFTPALEILLEFIFLWDICLRVYCRRERAFGTSRAEPTSLRQRAAPSMESKKIRQPGKRHKGHNLRRARKQFRFRRACERSNGLWSVPMLHQAHQAGPAVALKNIVTSKISKSLNNHGPNSNVARF